MIPITRLLLAFVAAAAAAFAAEVPKIAAKDAAKLVAEGKAVLVDCREPAEWKDGGVAAPAALLSKSDFDGEQKQWKAFLEKNQGKQIILYCRGGGRAAAVAGKLKDQGLSTANLGGIRDWTAAGLPTRTADAPAAK